MTINTTARMATKNINCQLVLAVGSQAIQRFNFISTVNLYWLWVHKPFNVSTNINCQLVLAVGSQAIQRFNFISTNFQPSTGFVVTPTIQR